MNEHRRLHPTPPTVIETLERSQQDLAAGRWENFDDLLARIDAQIEEHATGLATARSKPTRTK